MESFLQAIRGRVLIGDGAYGTILAQRGALTAGHSAPALNLTKPGFVKAVHYEYLQAGSNAIETNTFGADQPALDLSELGLTSEEVCRAGAELAREAVEGRAWVLGAVGPLSRAAAKLTPEEQRELFVIQVRGLVAGGADAVLLETFADLDDLRLAIEAVRAEAPKIPLIAQMAFNLSGTTTTGISPDQMVEALSRLSVDVIGANCGGGETAAVDVIRRLAERTDLPISVYPNRGLADFDEHGRPVFKQSAEYFARSARRLADLGANLVGGCCGTSPDDIRALKRALAARKPSVRMVMVPAHPAEAKPTAESVAAAQPTLEEELHRRVAIIAEVDPPRGVDAARQLQGVKALVEAGVDAITVADNPLSVLRMSNLAFAAMLMRETDVRVLLHIACRDRSLLGTQSHLLGAWALGISNILAVTGDPVATQAYKGSSGVFDMSSTRLIEMISRINRGEFTAGHDGDMRTSFFVGGAFNCATRSLENETKRLVRKVEAGARYVLTQPVFDAARAREVLSAIESTGVPALLGIMPLLSERNAEFLHHEVPGIEVPETVRKRMFGKMGKQGRSEGMAICRELMEEVADVAAGFYLITPMDRYGMVASLAKAGRSILERARGCEGGKA